MVVPEERGRDRIAVVGPSGSGKTTSILYLARHLIPLGHRFVFVEGDDGLTKCLTEFPDVAATLGTSLFRTPIVTNWGGFWGKNYGAGQVAEWVSKGMLGPNDWIVTEGLDILTTDLIRGEWVERVVGKHGNKVLASWDAIIEEAQAGHPVIDQSGWGAINGEVEKVLSYLGIQMPCNWIATTDIEPIRDTPGARGDDEVIKSLYHNMGMDVKMSGYKWLPRYFDTIVRTGRSLTSGYNLCVYKNRGQRAILGQEGTTGTITYRPNKDFYDDFGKIYMGWQ